MTGSLTSQGTWVSPASSTLRALDWLNFFLSGVQSAVGPFLAIYLASQGWSAQRIGLVLAVNATASIVAQTPVGWLVDWTRSKRTLIAIAVLAVTGSSLGIAAFPTFSLIVGTQVLIGAALTVFVPTVCAISLGLVGGARFDVRQGRNQAFVAAGSIVSALSAGTASYYSSNRSIFLLVMLAAIPALVMLARIPSDEINHAAARAAVGSNPSPPAGRFLTFLGSRTLMIFLVGAVLLNFANAALLPLLGEMVEQTKHRSSMLFMAACVIAAQTVMMLGSPMVGRKAGLYGRRPLLLVAFALLPARCAVYLVTHDPRFLIASEVLDGAGSSIFAVVAVLVIADLARGTGRFNLMLATMTMSISIGASLSQVSAGFIAHHYGFDRAFLFLTIIALLGFAVIALWMPETAESMVTQGADSLAQPNTSLIGRTWLNRLHKRRS